MKKVLFVLSMMTVLWSCKKAVEPTKGVESTNLKGSKNQPEKVLYDPTWDALGYGYDATGQYGNSIFVKSGVIDILRLESEQPTVADNPDTESSNPLFEAGSNSLDLMTKIGAKTELTWFNKHLFKNTLNAHYTQTDKFSSKFIYAIYQNKIAKKRLYLMPDYQLLQQYLHPLFQQHIVTKTPAELVELYGTHVLSNIIVGGQMELVYQAETKTTEREQAAGAGAEFSFSKIFNVSISGTYDQTKKQTNFNERVMARTVGGNSQQTITGITFTNGVPSATINVQGWSAGVTDENAELIDINPGGLIPLHKLIADPAKSAAVSSYIDQYIADRQVNLTPDPVYETYNNSLSDHNYSFNSQDQMQYSGWVLHGIGFKAFASQVPGTVPIYEAYHTTWYLHHYSTNQYASYGYSGWQNNGLGSVKFYAYNTQVAGTVPIYQYYSGRKDYLYTSNSNLSTQWPEWTKQGVAFYAFPN